MHSIGEVVKQFEFDVPRLQHPIKGKIVKYVSADGGTAKYTWSISYHYSPGGGVYHPSVITSSTLEEAVMNFRAYAQGFVADHEVEPNDTF
jgi:hypothetical protein